MTRESFDAWFKRIYTDSDSDKFNSFAYFTERYLSRIAPFYADWRTQRKRGASNALEYLEFVSDVLVKLADDEIDKTEEQLKRSMQAAWRKHSTRKSIKSVDISVNAWLMLSKYAKRHKVTLSQAIEVLIEQSGDSWWQVDMLDDE